jgi:hypothetical protein
MSIGALMGWRGCALAGVGAAVLAGGMTWIAQSWRYEAKLSDLRSEHSQYIEGQTTATLAAVEAARTEERRRTAAVEKARDEANEKARLATADAGNARVELGRLRDYANSLARAATNRDPTAADGSPTGGNAVDLLAYMLGRVSDRAAELAIVADRARITGLTCEAAYDGLTK